MKQKLNEQYLRAVAEVLEQAVESVLDEMVWTENRFEYSDLDSLRERLSFAKFKCCDVAHNLETREQSRSVDPAVEQRAAQRCESVRVRRFPIAGR